MKKPRSQDYAARPSLSRQSSASLPLSQYGLVFEKRFVSPPRRRLLFEANFAPLRRSFFAALDHLQTARSAASGNFARLIVPLQTSAKGLQISARRRCYRRWALKFRGRYPDKTKLRRPASRATPRR